jgi:hypothetical protein
MKKVLLAIVAELEELRANQAVLSLNAGAPLTTADAREARGLAAKQNREFFDNLRRQIEALP